MSAPVASTRGTGRGDYHPCQHSLNDERAPEGQYLDVGYRVGTEVFRHLNGREADQHQGREHASKPESPFDKEEVWTVEAHPQFERDAALKRVVRRVDPH